MAASAGGHTFATVQHLRSGMVVRSPTTLKFCLST
jgi:hypothetical protein